MPGPTPEQWRILSPHLDEALAMTEDERSSWLSILRVQNPSLVDQLERMLSHHRALTGEGFLLRRGIELPDASGLSGQALGSYTLLSQIGHGGTGCVWLAERNDARFERKVAVKLLNISLIGRAGEERFKREGMILGRLAHPNIAQLIDAGVSPGGQPYLILEHIDGDHIDRYCDARRLGVPARIRLFLDVLEAVAYAHENLVVHRDLKPPNILVRQDGEVKLLDFGIAKLLENEQQHDNTPLTLDGGRVMTPEYAAPEQLTGAAATPATDIYALGVLLYLLLTGRHPAGPSPHSPADLIKAILDIEPPRPSDAVPQSSRLRRILSGDLDIITGKALKKDPADRYTSIQAFADDLQRYLRQEPIRARPETLGYRAGKFLSRRSRSIAAGLVAALVLSATAIIPRMLALRQPARPNFDEQRLTANPRELPVLSAAISPNGNFMAYADQQGLHLQVIETGETQYLPPPPAIQTAAVNWTLGGWYPDSSRFIASVVTPGGVAALWAVSIHSQSWEKLADIDDFADRPAISPDGSWVAYGRRRRAYGAHELWLMGSHGESPHKIMTAEPKSSLGSMAWSPAGNRIAYIYARQRGDLPQMAVESCDLDGANRAIIVRDDALTSFAWLPSGRFIYARATQRGRAGAGDLWEVRRGKSWRLADWSGSFIYGLSGSADGKRLAFLRGTHHAGTFVGDLSAGGDRLINTHRLATDDNMNIALAWTPDSREVIFSSQRAASRQLYRQSLDPGSEPQPVTTVPDTNFYVARFSPDGATMFIEGEPIGSRGMALYQSGLGSGVPQLLFLVDGLTQYWCSNRARNLCVLGRAAPRDQELVVSSFTTSGINGNDLLRIPLEPGSSAAVGFDYAWQLSPDGLWIALLKRHENQIRLAALDGGRPKTIQVKGHPDLIDLNWGVDSRSFFVSGLEAGGAALLHVSLEGKAQSIWFQPQTTSIWGFQSPNGRHLAISSETPEANVWMIRNF